jgi:hypothetical protein
MNQVLPFFLTDDEYAVIIDALECQENSEEALAVLNELALQWNNATEYGIFQHS